MSIITFQDFASSFTRLSAQDLKAACGRYFRYRGMGENHELVEKHFVDFLHFLDLEDIFRSYGQSLERECALVISTTSIADKSDAVGRGHGLHAISRPKSISRAKRALKLIPIQ
jgi:hypothetical protein